MSNKEDEYKKLRSYLNNYIRGPNTDAVLKALATGPAHLVQNVEAVNDSLYIVSASGKYLDQRLGDKGVVRPAEVGLADDVFREIGIEITNRKQVRDLVHQLLRVLYGEIFTRATSNAANPGLYNLSEGDNLIISFDGSEPIEIAFLATQFQDINNATAQEVADAITKNIRKIGSKGAGFVQPDGDLFKVALISLTDGPSSSIKVLGGKAQSVLKFEEIRLTSADASTIWQITQEPSGRMRMTWVGGANPSIGKIKVGDYTNIYNNVFDILNQGTFTITFVQGGIVNEAYVEFENPNGINEIVPQGSVDGVLFFNPKPRTVLSNDKYAAAFQTSPRTLEVFMPATTKVVRRERSGAAHIYESGPSNSGQEGPYSFDLQQPFIVSDTLSFSSNEVNIGSGGILFLDNAADFPDAQGSIILGYGTSHQEGPVPYIAKASDQSLQINPSYRFKNYHPPGTEVSLIAQNSVVVVDKAGEDFAFYLTDSVAGRIYAEQLIKEITATGIVVIIYILYPNDEGFGKWGDNRNSEKYYIWGVLEDLTNKG
jgi:hypothetical protein